MSKDFNSHKKHSWQQDGEGAQTQELAASTFSKDLNPGMARIGVKENSTTREKFIEEAKIV